MATRAKPRPIYQWKIEASDWSPLEKGLSQQRFLTLRLPRLVLDQCTYHKHYDGRTGIGLPVAIALTATDELLGRPRDRVHHANQ
jgi:hypothetical protein